MQNLLLTIASAIILAVAAAFAAPFVVDWTQWRPQFEAQAARVVGAPVVIRGPIDAQILPTPRIVLRDVSIGVDGGGTGLTAAEINGRLSLGALMRGQVVADRLDMVRPRMRLVVDATGRLALPTGAVRPAGFTIAELGVVDGSLELIDRANDRTLKVDDIDLAGDIAGALGPARLEGEVETDGVRRRLRVSLAAFAPDGTGKLRLGLQNVGSPLSIDADGVLSLAGGKPSFHGRAALAKAATPALRDADGTSPPADPLKAWSLAGTADVTAQAIAVSDLSLTVEAAERPVELSGTARLTAATKAQPDSRLEMKLAARQIDLNAATGGAAPLAALHALAGTLAPLSGIASTGTLDLSTDTVLLSGAAMREVKAGLDWTPQGWRARAIQARLPGGARASFAGSLPSVSGRADPKAALFGGTAVLEAEDLPAFASWAAPEARALVAGLPGGPARLSADLNVAAGRFALDKLDLTAGDARFTGTAAYSLPQDGGRGRIDAVLATENVDLDMMLPAARRLVGLGMSQLDLGLSLSGKRVRYAGSSARSVDVILKGGTEGLGIERLAIADFAGLDLTGSGRLTGLDGTADADGRFEAKLSGSRADGLPALAQALGLTQAEPILAAMGPTLAPVDLKLTLDSKAGRSTLEAGGQLGSLTGSGRASLSGGQVDDGRVQLDAKDGSAVLTRLGVPGLKPGLGAAKLDLTLADRLDATLAFAGARLTAEGTLARDSEGRLQPDFALALDGADLALLLPELAAGAGRKVPANFKGALRRDGESWRVSGLNGSIGGQALDGNLAYTSGRPVEAELSTASWSVPKALGLVAGTSATASGDIWPKGRFGAAALLGVAADLKLNVGKFELPGGLVLGEAKLRAQLAGGRLNVEDLSGSLAGGRLAGRFNLGRQGEAAQFDGRVVLNAADSGQLLAAAGIARPGVRGRVTLALDLTGRGNSPFALASQLQGQGSLAVEGLEIDYSDPTALQYVMLATDRGLPPDQQKLVQLLNTGLSRGPLKLQRAESAVSVVDGVARTSAARLAVGEQRFGLSGFLDIPALSFEATLEMQDAARGGLPAQPAAAVQWRGTLVAPERRFDITALTAAINMRALDRETKRLEAEYGRTPLTNGGQATDPPRAQYPQPSPQALPQPLPQLSPQAAPVAPAAPPRPPAASAQPRAVPQSYYGQYAAPGAAAPGSAAPPLPPAVVIPSDPLLSPIMQPPLAP
ncbi:MAG: AsmA family protein [Xanthobacteraceae bacterium]|nr:AsmA family protein [Xanthobacteraceae bacterium]